MRRPRKQTAIKKINDLGVLLVFPVKNQKEPRSLWSELFPGREMVWEWSEDGQDEVPWLWALMKEMASERDVVYSKWYQDRATFFSRELFSSLIRLMFECERASLYKASEQILDELLVDSPLSTKELKAATDLEGKLFDGEYNRGLKQLFRSFHIVSCGEKDDGAFPSSTLGATQLIYEDLWTQARKLPLELAQERVNFAMPEGSLLRKYFDKHVRFLEI